MTRPIWRSRHGYYQLVGHVDRYTVTVGGRTQPVALDRQELTELRDALNRELPAPSRRRPGPTETKGG